MPTPTSTQGTSGFQARRSATAPKLVLEPVRTNSSLEPTPLAMGRYLIGAAPECDIVIDVGGIAPQHCLLIVGANKTIVKAISPLTWINDGPLSEAVLRHGERLILGPVELRTRRPEVSEWIEGNAEEHAPPVSPIPFEPPQIEELLDHARHQLQSVIDHSAAASPANWPDDLPLAEAVQIHAAAVDIAESLQAKPRSLEPLPVLAEKAPQVATDRSTADRDVELAERFRSLEYLTTQLESKEKSLLTREQSLHVQQAELEQGVADFEQRLQAVASREQVLQDRWQADSTASLRIEEMTRSLETEQARLRDLERILADQATEMERQKEVFAERTQTLQRQESDLAVKAETLHNQLSSMKTLVEGRPDRTAQIEQRERDVAQREGVLASSTAAIQSTREQMIRDAADLEQRFEELQLREQAVLQQEAALREQQSRSAIEWQQSEPRLAKLVEREQTLESQGAQLSEREAKFRKIQAELEERERNLRGLRSELDIREESLNQQFAQLQQDRSALRASQSKLQLAEQAANQRLANLDWSAQQRSSELEAEWERRRQELEAQAVEQEAKASEIRDQWGLIEAQQQTLESATLALADRERVLAEAIEQWSVSGEQNSLPGAQLLDDTAVEAPSADESALQSRLGQLRDDLAREQRVLEDLRHQIAEEASQHEQLIALRAEPSIPAVDRCEIETERQLLDTERARLEAERRELEELRVSLQTPQLPGGDEDGEIGRQLNALLAERQALEEHHAQLIQEQQELRTEKEEMRRSRERFEQDHNEIQAIKAEAATERDTYLIERQSVISDRQTLQDRERHIQQSEARIEALRVEAEQLRKETETGYHQMTSQRANLEEEWASLREERAELKKAFAELDRQREELTRQAQHLADLQAAQPTATSLPPATQIEFQSVDSPKSSIVRQSAGEKDEYESEAVSPETDQFLASMDRDDEVEPEPEEEPDQLAGFASFSTIGGAESDDEMRLPEAIAEIIRKQKAAAQSVATPISPAHDDSSVMTSDSRANCEDVSPAIDLEEEQRLHELLGRSSDSYVDAATADMEDGTEDESSDGEYAEGDAELSNEEDESKYGSPYTRYETTEPVASPDVTPEAAKIRDQLSAMFGIDLGRFSAPTTPKQENAAAPAREPTYERTDESYDSVSNSGDQEFQSQEADTEAEATDGDPESEQPAPEPEINIDEAADPVAAYMEQLLARTRKSREAGNAKTEKAAPKPSPAPVAPVAVQPEARPEPEEQPTLPPPRPVRKAEPINKEAMRANLDSFRSIANTRARSDVARSELRRLKIAEKVKQIFLGISGGIALILASTELWTTRRYRLEIAAGVIATAFLAFDYYRTQKRLRELAAIAPPELDEADDSDMDQGAAG